MNTLNISNIQYPTSNIQYPISDIQNPISVFITGNSRSGTTMMSRILGNHPDVFTFQELHFFDEVLPPRNPMSKAGAEVAIKLFATLCAIQRNGYFGSRNIQPFIAESDNAGIAFDKSSLLNVYGSFLQYETRKNGKTIPCEQTPQNIFYMDEIFSLSSNAKVIVMVRDPREVLLSQKNKYKRRELSGGKIPFWESVRSRINYHPVTISRIWNSVMKKAASYKNNPAVLFVKYEDLISNPESVIKNVCTHCGIAFNSAMLNIPVVGSSNFSDNAQKSGIDSSKSGQWQNGGLSAAEIHICQSVNEAQMKLFGYEKVNVNAGMLSIARYKFSLPFQLATALLFNLKRLKNPGKIIKRFTK